MNLKKNLTVKDLNYSKNFNTIFLLDKVSTHLSLESEKFFTTRVKISKIFKI